MAGEIGKATIEIVADLSRFPADLRRKLKAAFAEGVKGVDMHGLEEEASREGERAATSAGKSFERKAKTEFDKAGKSTGRGFLRAVGDIFRRGGGSDRDSIGGIFKGLFNEAQNSIQSGLTQLQGVGSKIGGVLGAIGSGGGDIASVIKVAAIASLIPAVFALGGALFQLSGILATLPALFGILGASIAPLIIGFQGFGTALSAGFSGDVKKFNEALKGLPLGMQAVIKEIVPFRSAFAQLKKDVQQSIFTELVGQVKPTLGILLPILSRGLVQAGGALSEFMAGFLEVLRAKGVVDSIRTIFSTAAGVIRTVGGALNNLFHTLFVTMGAGAPFAKRLFDALARGIQSFSDFLGKAIANGSFQKFLESAFQVGRELFALLKSVGGLIATVFGGPAAKKSGDDFLVNLTRATDKLNEFFKSADGKRFLDDLATTVHGLGVAIVGLVEFFGGFVRAMHDITDATKSAVSAIGGFFSAVGSGIATAATAVGSFFATIGGAVAAFFTQTIPSWFHAIVGFFQGLPDQAVAAGASLKAKLIAWITDAIAAVVAQVAFRVGQIIGFFFALPFLISNALQTLPGFIISHFIAALEAAKSYVAGALSSIWSFFMGLGARIRSALASLPGIIGGVFRDGFNAAKQFVLSGINQVHAFMASLPGRVASLGPAMRNAAAGLGRAIGQGLAQIGNFASDIGGKIVSTVKSGVNRIIGSINSGIANIDSKLPVGLPRLPFLERGGIIDSPTVALIGEKNKREVVLPLSDPRRTQELAQQSGLTKMLGQNSAPATVNLTAILDGFGVLRVVDMRIDAAMADQGSELSFGART